MPNVILVRHGQASAGTDDYDRLSPLGIRQASLLGEFWADHRFHIDAAFSGTLKRQQHTAELVLSAMATPTETTVLPALDEYNHVAVDSCHGGGVLSDGGSLSFDEYLNIMQRWQNAGEKNGESVESYQSFEQRGWQRIKQTALEAKPDSTLVFFTSGGIVSTVLKNILSLNFEQTMHFIWQTRNASVTLLNVSEKHSYVIDYNGIPHLLAAKDKKLVTQI